MLKRLSAFILALTMLCVTACSNDNSSDTSKADSSSSVSEQETDSSSDDSDNSSEADSSTKDSDSSEDDSSSKAESTTKKVDSSSSGDTSSKTTTKTTANTTPAVVTQPTHRTTTKATTRTTTKTTTKATTKATTKPTAPNVSIASWDKSDPSSFIKPAGLTRLQDAVWEMSKYNYDDKNLKIIREELIKYGQEYCKKKGATKYVVDPKMYPYYDKNGKPLLVPTDKNNNVIAVGSLVEFPYDEHDGGYSYFKSAAQRMESVNGFINAMHLYIERVICNSFRHGMEDIQWNITYGLENSGICWTVMTGFPDDWK